MCDTQIQRVNVADRTYIQYTFATRAFSIGEQLVNRTNSIDSAYSMIHSNNSKTLDITLTVVALDWWRRRLSDSRSPKNTVTYITDHNSGIIATFHTDISQLTDYKKISHSHYHTITCLLAGNNSHSNDAY